VYNKSVKSKINSAQPTLRVAIITCYFLPDYIRSLSLRGALLSLPNVETVVIKNTSTGILRYPQVLAQILWCRLHRRADIYLLGFRGQEILPATLLLTLGKPLIFDEFIVPLAWATQEGHTANLRTTWFQLLSRLSAPMYKGWLKACSLLLTDTAAHAELSAQLSGLPISHYRVLPVGTDESIFMPKSVSLVAAQSSASPAQSNTFMVFFYGLKMTPLHGFEVIVQAAEQLSSVLPSVAFTIIGGDETTSQRVQRAVANGARVTYIPYVPLAEIADHMRGADVCLGGPFGDTPQARHVVTGKTYQSLACARATIVGDTDAYTQFTHKKDCLKVALASPEAIAQAIIWAAKHPNELRVIGNAGRKLYETHFSTAVIAKRLETILKTVH
jgi:glycosyltransferase involved in cell wall biosynthesis